ncbi:unnamed protein product [Strongylus vulgaris]|uniref:Uncharacterized protein n=1 Tax=Strongylus vulgaris TaxID=40348 RepID=A0A3P7K9L4_STRVU|nr:unnamed protein product [Strongylus vulgaris]
MQMRRCVTLNRRLFVFVRAQHSALRRVAFVRRPLHLLHDVSTSEWRRIMDAALSRAVSAAARYVADSNSDNTAVFEDALKV